MISDSQIIHNMSLTRCSWHKIKIYSFKWFWLDWIGWDDCDPIFNY